ncbi:MAG: beta-propeller fold lactonase family protein [Chitinophagaceae bacterium]
MKKISFFVFSLLATTLFAQQTTEAVVLPNGWKLTPAGKSIPLGDLPLNMVSNHAGTILAVTNNGQSTQTIQLINVKTQTTVDEVVIPKSWYGLAFTKDDKSLYVSGGHDNRILKYDVVNDKLKLTDTISLGKPWPNRIGPAGITLDTKRNRLYVVTREDKKLYVIDLSTKTILGKYGMEAEAYDCKISSDHKELYISGWGSNQILVFNLETNRWTNFIGVGDNPNEMLISPRGDRLFVCNANDNTVSVIDLNTKRVVETLDAALYPNSLSGSTSNSIAINAKTNQLFIANADNNCIAVFDIKEKSHSVPEGFIPVGWYPTSVRIINNKLWVANGKGMSSKPNPFGPSPLRKREEVIHHGFKTKPGNEVEYIAGLFKGSLSIIDMPTATQLNNYSKAVYANSPYSPNQLNQASIPTTGHPIPRDGTTRSPIKYVFYVIKENRTYDQVLADLPGGNGDTSLLLFGRNITPNQHFFAEQFVLLDNFFVNAEVSADGHNWTMGAYANDYLEKTWPSSYGGRGGTYGGEGEREIANNKGGFFWDNCMRQGVSFRSYGEFVSGDKPTIKSLQNNICTYYPDYNLSIRDTTRVRLWSRDFDSLLRINKVPQFNTVRLGNDHTEGMKLGSRSPYAHVADNDLAVGMFIEKLASSPIWNETAVFVVEDDAQNGADHVDAHRSTAYLMGGFVKRGYVDHTLYTTTSMLRTMELILGLPPMTQYDAAATPMWRCFDTIARPLDFKPFIPAVDLNEKNVAINEWQRRSEKFDFAKEDSNNDIEFNRVLWHGLKGDRPFPGPKRSAFIFPKESDPD